MDGEFTFVKNQTNQLMKDSESRMYSIEYVREYLENEIGEDTLLKVYPILMDFSD